MKETANLARTAATTARGRVCTPNEQTDLAACQHHCRLPFALLRRGYTCRTACYSTFTGLKNCRQRCCQRLPYRLPYWRAAAGPATTTAGARLRPFLFSTFLLYIYYSLLCLSTMSYIRRKKYRVHCTIHLYMSCVCFVSHSSA